jgi:serine/threonine protein phosphatase PrpC
MTRNNGRFARTCGCTSIIVYLHGTSLWSACSGDSRAVMGSCVDGSIVARDLSEDCKPDTPSETARILAAGGTVSAATGARPSRVWANGKIGLAMSRSIGDGECKKYGVIAEPDVKHFKLSPAAGSGDGDKFLIVASDGVWEFITSQEVREPTPAHTRAL